MQRHLLSRLTRYGRQGIARVSRSEALLPCRRPDRRASRKCRGAPCYMFACISTLSPLLSSPGLGGGWGWEETEESAERTTSLLHVLPCVCTFPFGPPASALQVSRLGLATRARKETLKMGGGPRDPRAPSFCGSRARGCGGGCTCSSQGR